MVAPILAAALPAAVQGLISLVPSIARFIGGEKAGQVADTVVKVAQTVTGTDTPDDALAALKADPAKVLELQNAMMAHERAWWAEETTRLTTINATIQTELNSGDKYVRRMRPTWGYSMCAAFTAQMMAVTYTVIFEPQYAAEIVASLANLSVIWSVGLSVLGIYVWKRSEEKKGTKPPAGGGSLLSAITQRAGR